MAQSGNMSNCPVSRSGGQNRARRPALSPGNRRSEGGQTGLEGTADD